MTPPGPGSVALARDTSRRWSDLRPRLASAMVLMVVAIVTAWAGGTLFAAVWVLAGTAVLWEWLGLVGAPQHLPCLLPGVAGLAVAALLAGAGHPAEAGSVLVLAAIMADLRAPADLRGWAGAGVLYAGSLAAAVPLLRQSDPFGLSAILWLFAVVWGTDTMAFVGGRLIGGPKLAPSLSPSKTWSGFLVGVTSGALLGLLVAPRGGPAVAILLIGLAGGVLAQAGDLFESALKRRFGAKDAGALIPGHGGVMDRLDGFIATSVFAAILGLWRFGPPSAGAGLFRW